jgi:transcriptional regulator with XRE-family HTH domain
MDRARPVVDGTELGKRLKAVREARKVSAEGIANFLGKSTATVRRIENGEREIGHTEFLAVVAFLGIDQDDLNPPQLLGAIRHLVETRGTMRDLHRPGRGHRVHTKEEAP